MSASGRISVAGLGDLSGVGIRGDQLFRSPPVRQPVRRHVLVLEQMLSSRMGRHNSARDDPALAGEPLVIASNAFHPEGMAECGRVSRGDADASSAPPFLHRCQ